MAFEQKAMNLRSTLPHSMKITEDIRQFAAEQGMDTVEAVEAGMREKAGEFREAGGEIYVPEEVAGER